MATIVFKNVTKKYGKSTAINHINLEVKEGEFMVLVGPSGCGKSTLLRMIAGLEEIDEGQLYIDGNMVNDLPPKDRDIAIVFQNYALYPHMTAYENLAFGLKIRGVDKATIKNKVEQVAVTLEITELLQRKPKDMSGGQRQRVAIGRAIVRDPKVFLFDEPLSNLDAKLRTQMRLEIADLHKKLKTTIVYVTHDQVEAMTLGDRVAVMNKGEVSQIGTLQELYKHPANIFVAGFIGSPAMNFIEGMIKTIDGKAVFMTTDASICIPISSIKNMVKSEEVTLGIRPEHISIGKIKDVSGHSFQATILHIERMGYENFITAEVTGSRWIIRTVDGDDLGEGSQVWCTLDADHFHFF
jgi:multiple sugar transport system ATP-binding protein